jgi:hypothetical protein
LISHGRTISVFREEDEEVREERNQRSFLEFKIMKKYFLKYENFEFKGESFMEKSENR